MPSTELPPPSHVSQLYRSSRRFMENQGSIAVRALFNSRHPDPDPGTDQSALIRSRYRGNARATRRLSSIFVDGVESDHGLRPWRLRCASRRCQDRGFACLHFRRRLVFWELGDKSSMVIMYVPSTRGMGTTFQVWTCQFIPCTRKRKEMGLICHPDADPVRLDRLQ